LPCAVDDSNDVTTPFTTHEFTTGSAPCSRTHRQNQKPIVEILPCRLARVYSIRLIEPGWQRELKNLKVTVKPATSTPLNLKHRTTGVATMAKESLSKKTKATSRQ
jgi:hypothetical protein